MWRWRGEGDKTPILTCPRVRGLLCPCPRTRGEGGGEGGGVGASAEGGGGFSSLAPVARRPWGVDPAMCGRYTLYTDLGALQARFGLDVVEGAVGRRYNIAPTQQVLTARGDGGGWRGKGARGSAALLPGRFQTPFLAFPRVQGQGQRGRREGTSETGSIRGPFCGNRPIPWPGRRRERRRPGGRGRRMRRSCRG